MGIKGHKAWQFYFQSLSMADSPHPILTEHRVCKVFSINNEGRPSSEEYQAPLFTELLIYIFVPIENRKKSLLDNTTPTMLHVGRESLGYETPKVNDELLKHLLPFT